MCIAFNPDLVFVKINSPPTNVRMQLCTEIKYRKNAECRKLIALGMAFCQTRKKVFVFVWKNTPEVSLKRDRNGLRGRLLQAAV